MAHEYWREWIKAPVKLPSALTEKMLAYSGIAYNPNMDPFTDSGQTGVCAIQMGRKFTGFEIVPDHCNFTNKRTSAAQCTDSWNIDEYTLDM